ncbi:MAG: hypothetical protein AAFQ54_00370 [Pseudomonadota bacterium]
MAVWFFPPRPAKTEAEKERALFAKLVAKDRLERRARLWARLRAVLGLA